MIDLTVYEIRVIQNAYDDTDVACGVTFMVWKAVYVDLVVSRGENERKFQQTTNI